MATLKTKVFTIVTVASLCVIGCLKIELALNKRKAADGDDAVGTLSDKQQSKVTIKHNILTQTVKNKLTGKVTSKKKYVPPEAKVTVVTDKDANTDIIFNDNQTIPRGLCFTPDVSLLKDYNKGYLAVGAKFYYWSRFSASAGVGVYDFKKACLKPYVAVDYNIYNNTKVGVYYNFKDVGMKISFSF
ncbi:hypothetical protein AGMMS49995_10370 [Endomicrobiia bacterium]|nr:hypothetical protein AGMMS49995_10370 [Endomicrobiia bacterium]